MSEQATLNTDRELWRGPDEGGGDFYADSIHVTKDGGIGINCGGHVIVMPLRDWHRLARNEGKRCPFRDKNCKVGPDEPCPVCGTLNALNAEDKCVDRH